MTTLVDIDQDNDLDALAGTAWFKNYDGQGNWAIHSLPIEGTTETVAVDLDQDGDQDFVAGNLSWLENIDGSFAVHEIDVPAGFADVTQIRTLDAGQDGQLDVAFLTATEAAHYEFTPSGLQLIARLDRPANAAVADLDIDGDLDFAFVDVLEQAPQDLARVWIRTTQGDSFADELFTSAPVSFFGSYPTRAGLRDINSDGLPDLLIHSVAPDFPTFSWYWHENQLPNGGAFDARGTQIISTYMANIIGVLDADGDGDLDGVAEEPVGGPNVTWSENDGQGQFTAKTLCECGFGARPTAGGDLDGDGVFDIVLAEFQASVPVWLDGATGEVHQNVPHTMQLEAGDANRDFRFDAADLVLVAQGGKFATGADAVWSEGDWNGAPGGSPAAPPPGDGVFDQADLDAALASGLYRRGLYVPSEQPARDDLQPLTIRAGERGIELQYDRATGNVTLQTPEPLSVLRLVTASLPLAPPATTPDDPYSFAAEHEIFLMDLV